MGDQYLNIGRKVLDWINMCQKRSGRSRSKVSSSSGEPAARPAKGRPSDVFGGEIRRRDVFPLLVLHLIRSPYVLPTLVVESSNRGLYGSVGDSALLPLVAAKVAVLGVGGREVATDSAGRFAVPEATGGTYMVRVSKPGYAERHLVLDLPKGAGRELSFRLANAGRTRFAPGMANAYWDLDRRLAFEFRQRFGKDVVVDLVCYRRHGHNELDDPTFTQPLMYRQIEEHPAVAQIYAQHLEQEKKVEQGESERIRADVRRRLDQAHGMAKELKPRQRIGALGGVWEGLSRAGSDWSAQTAVEPAVIRRVTEGAARLPPGFTLHRKLQRLFAARAEMAAGKRPLSSMTPTIVLRKDGSFWFALGARGGPRIISAVVQTIVNMIDHDMDLQQAMDAPRMHHQWLPDVLWYEKGLNEDTIRLLQEKGHKVMIHDAMGSTQSIMKVGNFFYGASDPRTPGALTLGH